MLDDGSIDVDAMETLRLTDVWKRAWFVARLVVSPMQRYLGLLGWAWALTVASVAMADDFLFVLATPPGQRSEIHWVPANAPRSARVLLEDLEQTTVLHRYGDELWWLGEEGLMQGNLVAQDGDSLMEFGGAQVSNIVRQGNMLYWMTASELGSFDLVTKDRQVLAVSDSTRTVLIPDELFFPTSESGFQGLVVHEDRLYFGDGPMLETMRLDGEERRQVGARDHEPDGLQVSFDEFGGVMVTPVTGTRGGVAVHDGRVLWVKDGALWQMDLSTEESSAVSGELPETVQAMTVTDEAVYWVGDRMVWRWKLGEEMHEPLYELGDTAFHAITAVSARPRQTVIWDKDVVGVMAEEPGVYQLLVSEDLQTWSVDYVRRSVFTENGVLGWLNPHYGEEGGSLSWRVPLDVREAYFAVWQYDLGEPFDADGDGLPDYWGP